MCLVVTAVVWIRKVKGAGPGAGRRAGPPEIDSATSFVNTRPRSARGGGPGEGGWQGYLDSLRNPAKGPDTLELDLPSGVIFLFEMRPQPLGLARPRLRWTAVFLRNLKISSSVDFWSDEIIK